MDGAVLQRVVFVEQTADGYFRFADWALTTTRLGAMAEPFAPRHWSTYGEAGAAFDPTDDMTVISDIRHVNSDLIPTLLAGGGIPWCAGNLMPRTGR